MRIKLTSILLGLAVLGSAQAQTRGPNQSVDPAWLYVPEAASAVAPSITEPVMGSDIPVDIRFVELLDGVYAPIGYRKPQGPGPFPTIVFAHMNGGFGLRWVREWTQYGSGTLERFLDAGYAVVWMRYRAEVDTQYGSPFTEREFQGRQRFSRGPLEYQDAISIIEFVKQLPDVDPDRIGWVGVSHGGEMLFKIASEYHGLRAGIASEPAASDYLARRPPDPNAPREEALPETMDVNTEAMQREATAALRARLDMATATSRIDAITTPIFVVGRDRDHNQATFRLAYELLAEAGKDTQWKSYNHDAHGFIFLQRNADGIYDPDPIQREVLRDALAFFDRYMK
jgi:dipeptidyl aminopeptidase/acylaminoacyl peptidase